MESPSHGARWIITIRPREALRLVQFFRFPGPMGNPSY